MSIFTIILVAITIAGTMAAPLIDITSTQNITTTTNTTQPLTERNTNAACISQNQKREYPHPGPTERYHAIYPEESWPSFDCLFEMNRPSINAKNQNPNDASQLKQAILNAHSQTAVDPRIILAVLMQESHGELRVGRTLQPDDHVSASNGVMQCWGCQSAAGSRGGRGWSSGWWMRWCLAGRCI